MSEEIAIALDVMGQGTIKVNGLTVDKVVALSYAAGVGEVPQLVLQRMVGRTEIQGQAIVHDVVGLEEFFSGIDPEALEQAMILEGGMGESGVATMMRILRRWARLQEDAPHG